MVGWRVHLVAVLTGARGNRSPGAAVTGSYGLSDLGAGNLALIIWKGSKYSQLLIISLASNPTFQSCSSTGLFSIPRHLKLHCWGTGSWSRLACFLSSLSFFPFPLLFSFLPSLFCDSFSLHISDSPNPYYEAQGRPKLLVIFLLQPRECIGSLLNLDWSSLDLYMPVISFLITFFH